MGIYKELSSSYMSGSAIGNFCSMILFTSRKHHFSNTVIDTLFEVFIYAGAGPRPGHVVKLERHVWKYMNKFVLHKFSPTPPSQGQA